MEKMDRYDLSIIIVNYNGGEWLEMTLDTLKRWYLDRTTLQVQVLVVDNHSTDDSLATAQRNHSWIETLQLDKNYGFAIANNRGIEATNSQYVMLLNSDVEFDQRSNLDHLVEYLADNPQAAAITPQLILPSGELDWASHRGEPTPWASLTYYTGLESLLPQIPVFSRYHLKTADLSQIHSIEACSGAAMVVRRSAIDQVGLLDESFFMYAEDLDWCKRFREAKYDIIYYPAVILIHHKNKSGIDSASSKTAQKTSYHFYQTMVQYYDKHYKDDYPRALRWIIKQVTDIKHKLS